MDARQAVLFDETLFRSYHVMRQGGYLCKQQLIIKCVMSSFTILLVMLGFAPFSNRILSSAQLVLTVELV